LNIPTVKLSSGYEMPLLGLGTWRLRDETCTRITMKALELGYTHIDTAEMYENHADIGAAIRHFERSKLFITSKVPQQDLQYKSVRRMCEKALRELGTDYLDLYLIHWPNPDIPLQETLQAFEELHEEGKIRNIGVSNFTIRYLTEATQLSRLPVANNQVEFHPLLYQKELLEFCKNNRVTLTAYAPIARGRALENQTIVGVARKLGKTPAQVSLRWLVQKGIAVIPKTSSEERLRENMDIFDWELPPEDERKIDAIPERVRLLESPLLDE